MKTNIQQRRVNAHKGGEYTKINQSSSVYEPQSVSLNSYSHGVRQRGPINDGQPGHRSNMDISYQGSHMGNKVK